MKTKFHSYKLGKLPLGCKLCVTGKKTVVYITGVCPRHCSYCPLSPKKKDLDVIYANEEKLDNKTDIANLKQLINEAKSHKAKGAGITGGDPLAKNERTVKYIKAMKKEFGKKFHIHLYTSFNLANEKNLSALYKAGLDEIRFHPDLDDNKIWNRLDNAIKFDWHVGVEIPMIPNKLSQTKKLITFIYGKVEFINLNEFEYSDAGDFTGYETKNPSTYAIKNSLETGLKIMDFVNAKNKKEKGNLNVHLCTAKLKDRVQLRNRIKLKSKFEKTKVDKISKDGLLVRHCIYLKDHSPRTKTLEKMKKDSKKYVPLIATLCKKMNFQNCIIDEEQARLIVSRSNLLKCDIDGVDKAIVEEYPTTDRFITQIDFLE